MSSATPSAKIRGNLHRLRSTQTRLYRSLWQRRHNPGGYTAPVFLVGCGRSGTSMILHHLSRSQGVEAYNENQAAAFEKWRLRPPEAIAQLIQQSHAQVALFKPILNTHQSRDYLLRFPNARLLFVYRHYDDVINSSLKRFGAANRLRHVHSWIEDDFNEFAAAPPPEQTKATVRSLWKPSLTPEEGASLYWLYYNWLYFALELEQEARVRLVSYESLVANPVAVLTNLCCFLGLKFEPAMAEGIYGTSVGRDSQPVLDTPICAACEALWRLLRSSTGDI